MLLPGARLPLGGSCYREPRFEKQKSVVPLVTRGVLPTDGPEASNVRPSLGPEQPAWRRLGKVPN